ncbi:MAG: hypothetical protein EP341_04230 [Sphingomonadales bacterium]|nr:MAG: hypothetical protein EP341_04230 [Sphingomonadales bacterium]
MLGVSACDVPAGSLLAQFGGPGDYRDCFVREVAGEVTLEQFVERFYCSMAFRPERIVLGLIGRKASNEDARKLARGETDRFGVWEVVERRENQILLESRGTGTASWLSTQPAGDKTKLLFGSWVGNLEQSGWRIMQRPHQWYSQVLLSGC